MRDYPKGGLIGKSVAALRAVAALQIPLHAAYTGFFLILSLFPALLLILGLLRYTALDVESLVALIGDFLPGAMLDMAEELIIGTYQSATGTVVGVSAVTALWSSSRGLYGLLRGLNAVCGVTESRGWLHRRAISALYTFAFLVVLLLTLALHVFGRGLIGLLTMVDHPVVIFLTDLIDLRFFLLLFLQSGIFSLMYMALPSRRARFRDCLPGGVAASLGWLVFSDLFSIYVENFSRYANIYGSVYAVAVSMLWIYSCMSILFYGGLVNRYLREKE